MVRGLALLLTVFTGFTGLVYEVSWQRALATLLGSHSEATAAVLGIFLGGLSLGYSLFGWLTRRFVERARSAGEAPRLLTLYGAVEVSIGLWAMGFMILFAGVQAVSFRVPEGSPGLGFAIDVVLTILLIGPPTVLMGGTIPILTQALARNVDDATRFHAFVYGFNTVGAFAGALAAGFWLVPMLGIPAVLELMGLINIGAGIVFAMLDRVRPAAASLAEERAGGARVRGFALYAVVALLLGFSMMAIQTVLVRVGGLALGSSHFTFSMVVAVFVLCIALGSLAVSAFSRIRPAALVACVWGLAGLLYLLYLELPNSTYGAALLRSAFRDDDVAFLPYHAAVFLVALSILALPVGLSGATLPLIFNEIRREIGELGHAAGRLYSWNTVGSLLGALLGGYALLFWLDLHHVYRLALAAAIVAACLLTVRVYPLPRIAAGALLLAGLLLVAVLPAWEPVRLAAGMFRVRQPDPEIFVGADAHFANLPSRVIFYDDDPTTSVAVKERQLDDGQLNRSIITNGKSDSSTTHDYPTQALAALLPCLFADACESAFVVGYGTGVTAGELAALESMQEVTVAEIAQGVIDAAPLFDFANQRASHDPKVRMVRGDAYRSLMRSTETFDVISSEPSNPWVTGVEMLYSREFLEAARSRLRPGGVYAQWVQLYETDQATLQLVLQTYASVFDAVSVWYTLGTDLLLLGFDDSRRLSDLDRLLRRMLRPDFAAGLRRAGVASAAELLAHEMLPVGVLHAMSLSNTVHTLFHPLLSHQAARAFFLGGNATVPTGAALEPARIGRASSLLRRYLERREGGVSADLRRQMLSAPCGGTSLRPEACATFLAQWLHDDPDSAALAEYLAEARASPLLREQLSPALLSALAGLFGPPQALGGGDVSFEQAWTATLLFANHYQHAVPFERRVLASMWRRCRDASDRCDDGRRRAEQGLGPLSETADPPSRAH